MDLSIILLAGFVVGLTTFVLSRNGRVKNSVTITEKGEQVIRAADMPDRLLAVPENNVETVYESFEYVNMGGERGRKASKEQRRERKRMDRSRRTHINSRRALKEFGNKRCVGTRSKTGKDTYGEYKWKTYKEINTKANNFGFGLVKLGAKPV